MLPAMRLALGELEPTARTRLAVLLALDGAAVAGEEAGLLQRRAELGVQVAERAGDAVADRAGLAGEATADHVHGDVDLAELLHDLERLPNDHLRGLAPEVLVVLAAVDDDLAVAR